jgi:hypothetical protein
MMAEGSLRLLRKLRLVGMKNESTNLMCWLVRFQFQSGEDIILAFGFGMGNGFVMWTKLDANVAPSRPSGCAARIVQRRGLRPQTKTKTIRKRKPSPIRAAPTQTTSVWVSRPGAVSASVSGIENEDDTGGYNESETKTWSRPSLRSGFRGPGRCRLRCRVSKTKTIRAATTNPKRKRGPGPASGVGFAARGGVGFGVGYRKRRRYGRLQQLRNDNHTHADFEYPILGFGIYQKGEDGDPRLYWFKWFDGSTTDS